MENISLSFPKRSFSSNTAVTSHKSIYEDVFGGHPKLGVPNLAPRCEDYSEIFGGFHTSQSSSIPVLHLPLTASENSSLLYDIDYMEVFGGCEGFDCTASVEDLVGQSTGGYDSDSSDDPWSPAQSGSMSDELDPVAGSDKSQMSSDGDFRQSGESINKKTASYSKSCCISAETVVTATGHVTNFSAVPGYTFNPYESPLSWDGIDEDCSVGVTNNTNHNREYGARVTGEKQPQCASNPLPTVFDTHRIYSKPLESHVNSTSQNKPYVSVYDISLRTKPSRLPPPSRPPPLLVVKKGERDKQTAQLNPSQHYTSDRVAGDIAPAFFDVEINATISTKGGECENRNVEVSCQGTKELAQRENVFSHSPAEVEGGINETVREASESEDERFLQSRENKSRVPVPVVEERIKSIESTKQISGTQGVQCFNNSAHNSANNVSWRESNGYFELLAETKGNENEVEAKLKRKDPPTRTDNEKMFVGSKIIEPTGRKLEQDVFMEEFQRTFEDVKGAEVRESTKERTEAEGIEIQSSGGSEKQSAILGNSNMKSADTRLDCVKDMKAGKLMENESASRKGLDQTKYDKDHKLIHELDVNKESNQGVSKTMNNYLRFRIAETEAGEKEEDFRTTGNLKLSTDTCLHEDLNKHADGFEPFERDVHDEKEVEWDLDDHIPGDGEKLKVPEGGSKVDAVTETKVLGKHDNVQMLGETKTKPRSSAYESEIGKDNTRVVGGFPECSMNKEEPQEKKTHSETINTVKITCVPTQMYDSKTCGSGMGVTRFTSGKISSTLGYHGESQKMNNDQFTIRRVDINDNCYLHHSTMESTSSGAKIEKDSTGQAVGVKKANMKGNLAMKDQKVGERVRRENMPENEHMRKLEEEREREREREKDRMAVDKAALEARERSYFESHERAERAAVERTTAEVRQRALAEAQERLEKASAEARSRTDRFAVERATAEARQRAAEKLMAQKAANDHLYPVERPITDRFSASSRSTDSRQSFLSSHTYFQGTGISNRLRYSHPSAHDGAESESPQRCKARLERYRRTAERAANALAEKNRRDLLAQREREERNRVAETLDAEVKRWSSGKQGNLRALLSTLQYILGPDNGWYPVSLTEIITSAAVKKAYRRATLCVHPDKLQQRGATIQQKFICEKVFDLLKEAWNKFNSEEQ